MTYMQKTGDLSPALYPLTASNTELATRVQYRRQPLKTLSQSASDLAADHPAISKFVAEILCKSFPACANHHDIAHEAAPYFLKKNGQEIDPRTIQYWLAGTTLPSAPHFITLARMQPMISMRFLFRMLV